MTRSDKIANKSAHGGAILLGLERLNSVKGVYHGPNGPRLLATIGQTIQDEVNRVFAFGRSKHGEDSWRSRRADDYFKAALRHLEKWESGESREDESGLLHLAHAIADIYLVLKVEAEGTTQGHG